jgi:hypothetical protein
MKIIWFYIFLLAFSLSSSAQNQNLQNQINISTGRVSFGTGDFFGYSVSVEYLKSFKKNSKHFSPGVELTFENGSTSPKVINPTFQEFFSETYYSTTNIFLTPKIYYYPFSKTFLKGLNIAIGLPVGYTSQNREFQSSYRYDTLTQTSIRRSYLEYINKIVFGYKINAGYDLIISKKILAGVRLDFCNTNGDINTIISAKVGYSF